jgi:hypothetical protein
LPWNARNGPNWVAAAAFAVVLPVAYPAQPAHYRVSCAGYMNEQPVATLVWTFGLMSLFAFGGANSAIAEMHRIAVECMTG